MIQPLTLNLIILISSAMLVSIQLTTALLITWHLAKPFIFLFFIMSSLLLTMGTLFYLKERITHKDLWNKVGAFVVVEFILTFLMISALVKIIFYDYSSRLAETALITLLVLALLHKVIAVHIPRIMEDVWRVVSSITHRPFLRQLTLVIGVISIFLITFVPDIQRVLARMYVGEQFHHVDIFVMAAGWASSMGALMDVDQISQYGVGMPYVFAALSRLMGGFSYDNVFLIIMWGNIIYFCILFLIAARVLRSSLLGFAFILVLLRVQLFHPGAYPFALTYPSATAIRYLFDIGVFWVLWQHLSVGGAWRLWLASVLCGCAMYYMDSTGIFLTAAFYFYMLLLIGHPQWRSQTLVQLKGWGGLLLVMALPIALTTLFLFITVGNNLWTAAFWGNFLETIDYFLSGIGTYPMNESFKYHNFFAGFIGFIIPIVYVWTTLSVGARAMLGQISRRHLWIVVLCIYGLGINHYYIARSLQTSYYVTAWPLMVVCAYWLKMLITRLNVQHRQQLIVSAVALAIYALVTNHSFIAYPNLLNLSPNPMVDPLVTQPLPADRTTYFFHLTRKEGEELKLPVNSLLQTDEQLFTERNFRSDQNLVAYYTQDFDFSRDAQMIQRYTQSTDKVPLVSSFEIKILMQAKRAPFFYYFPLINSRAKHMRTMPLNFLHTNVTKFNNTAINQIVQAKPEYIFLENIFLIGKPKPAYLEQAENVWPIIEYILKHYAIVEAGQYISALKRK